MMVDVLLTTEDGFVLTTEDGFDLFVGSIEVEDQPRGYGGGGGHSDDQIIESALELAALRAKNAQEAAQLAAKTIGQAQTNADGMQIGKIQINPDTTSMLAGGELQAAKQRAIKRREEDTFLLSILMMLDDSL